MKNTPLSAFNDRPFCRATLLLVRTTDVQRSIITEVLEDTNFNWAQADEF
ncbi:hypothetical protein OK016_23665 [Vibrio chagasii]|nr:hypothetical protein [Vibrio chagasii]